MVQKELKSSKEYINGREFEWTPGIGDGQRGLVCCNSWDRKESDMTEQLNWTEHASKVMLKILQARLQQNVNFELPGVQARFIKGRGSRD